MSAIERGEAHFSRQQVRVIEVPEWAGEDGQPLLIYAKPLTLTEKQKLRYYTQNGSELEVLAYTLIMKAEDAQGNKLYTVAAKHSLMNKQDPEVIGRIAAQISRPRSEDELEKK